MSALPAAISPAFLIGQDLTQTDLRDLAQRFVAPESAIAQGIRRVTKEEGQQLVGRTRGDMSGLAIPYILPTRTGIIGPRAYRVRRDHPDYEIAKDGSGLKEKGKYLGAPGSANLLFFPVDVTFEALQNPGIPVVIVEGELKALGLQCAARDWLKQHPGSPIPFLAIGVPGVYNWYGIIGKTTTANGTRVDVKGPISDLDHFVWPNRDVYIAYDADIVRKSQVKAARTSLRQELRFRGGNVGVLEWEESKGKGVDDFLYNQGPQAFFELLEKARDTTKPGGWKSRLQVGKDGAPKALLGNALKALRYAPEWDGVLKYNNFALRVEVARPTPFQRNVKTAEWTEPDDCLLTEWLQDQSICVHQNIVGPAVQTIARDDTYHPVKEYLNSLTWDGEPRVDVWLTEYMGAAPSNYTSIVGRCWLISAVARACDPGCKVDTGLILEGKQGTYKSSAIQVLASEEWFTDHIDTLGTKDAAQQLAGIWIMEFAELDKFGRTETNKLKQFWSQQNDRHRFAYSKHAVKVPRSCVFIATTNEEEYFDDETGARRFWPVKCTTINIEALRHDRDQLWAEAVDMYREGKKWYFDEKSLLTEAAQQQANRFKADPWQETIARWLTQKEEVSVDEILRNCLDLSMAQCTRRESIRMGKIMKVLKWERLRAPETEPGKTRPWFYRREAE